MLRSCRNKCIPEEYGEADLNKGEMVCVDRCVAKYYATNLKIGQVSMTISSTMIPQILTKAS